MFYCPHDPHFALLLATSAEGQEPSPAAVVSLTALVAAVILGIALML